MNFLFTLFSVIMWLVIIIGIIVIVIWSVSLLVDLINYGWDYSYIKDFTDYCIEFIKRKFKAQYKIYKECNSTIDGNVYKYTVYSRPNALSKWKNLNHLRYDTRKEAENYLETYISNKGDSTESYLYDKHGKSID